MAKDAKRVYPHAVSLMETVRTYGQTLDLVENDKGIEWLVAEYRNEAQRMVSRGKQSLVLPSSDFYINVGVFYCRHEHTLGLLGTISSISMTLQDM
jgi:hypothetical protein